MIHLGASGLLVSPLGVGTNSWRLKPQNAAALRTTFETAIEQGVGFFDTAEVYGFGASETALGQLMRETGRKPLIATKFLPYPWRLEKSSLLSALRSSLDRLQLAQVDLYLIHWPIPPLPVETWMDALAEAVKAGLARAAGVSNFNLDQMRRAQDALGKHGIPLACNQVEYNLMKRGAERSGLLAACRELGVTLVAYHPVAMGLLSGRFTPENPPVRLRHRLLSQPYLARVQPVIALLARIGEAHGGKTPSQVVLNWLMCKGALPIPGTTSAQHLRENAGALGWRLEADEIASLDDAENHLHLR